LEKHMIETRRIPVKKQYDVIVAGGGIGGIAAALSAARRGLRVLLMEKSAVLGGLSTLGLIHWYEPLCDGKGHQLVSGIAQELLELSIRHGYDNLPKEWGGSGNERTHDVGRYATLFNPAMFSLALNALLMSEGVDMQYDLLASYPVMEENICRGVIGESKGGRAFYPAQVVVDATGDADLLFRAGVPCTTGKNYLTYIGHGCNRASMEKALAREDMVWLNARGFSVGSDLNGNGHPEGMPLFEGVDGELVSRYIQHGQTLLYETLKDGPKNEKSLYTLPGMAQLRTTRCLKGANAFHGIDGKKADDSIGTTGDFRYPSRRYDIPAGVLYHKDYPSFLAAGRVVSAQGDGWEITRVIPTCALTGQASGVYAWQMVKNGIPAAMVDVRAVQDALREDGVHIHFDDVVS
jgi:hypothetical protein